MSRSRPPLAENWVHLEVGDREASLCEDKHNGTNVSEDDKTLLRQEASKLSAPVRLFTGCSCWKPDKLVTMEAHNPSVAACQKSDKLVLSLTSLSLWSPQSQPKPLGTEF